MDAVFKALSDAHRRQLLDALFQQDGQTSAALEAALASEMSRFGVMKHLKILEAAGLITTHKIGRFKYHYLNPVPIQQLSDRWISRFARPWVQQISTLQQQLESSEDIMQTPKHIYVTIIKTSPEKLWAALTDPQQTPLYYYGSRLVSDLTPGAEFNYVAPDNQLMVSGKVLEARAPNRLVVSFTGNWDPAMQGDAPSRVTYEIEQQGDCCKLTVTHDDFAGETPTYQIVGGGWPGILSGLKTLLETGQPMGYNPMAA